MRNTIEGYAERIGNSLNTTPEKLKEKSRKREIVSNRQICSWVLWQLDFTQETIGGLFSQDHSTVINSIQVVNHHPPFNRIAKGILEEVRR